MSKLSRLSHCGIAAETTMGTPVAPTIFVPWESFDPEDDIAEIRDESMKANDTVLQGLYPGIAQSMVSLGGKLYPGLAGFLLRAIIGPDTIGALSAGLYPHTFKTNLTQPKTYTITDVLPGVSARAYPGLMCSELTIKVDTGSGDATYDSKWVGWNSATASVPVPAYTDTEPFLGWQLLWSAGGTSSTRVENTTLSIKRDVSVIAGSDGTQSPRETFAGGLTFDASGNALFEDETDLNRFLAYGQSAVVATLQKPVARGGESLALTSTLATWKKAKPNRGQKYATLDFTIEGAYSATDAGPVQALLKNLASSAY